MEKNEISAYVDRLSEEACTNRLKKYIRQGYTIIEWPESQELMNEPWFKEEAVLEIEGKFGSSAYFVPIHRLIN